MLQRIETSEFAEVFGEDDFPGKRKKAEEIWKGKKFTGKEGAVVGCKLNKKKERKLFVYFLILKIIDIYLFIYLPISVGVDINYGS